MITLQIVIFVGAIILAFILGAVIGALLMRRWMTLMKKEQITGKIVFIDLNKENVHIQNSETRVGRMAGDSTTDAPPPEEKKSK